MNRRAMLSCVAVLVALVAAACGSNSPSTPSGSGAVVVQGVVLGGSAAASLSASSHAQANTGTGKITVTVAGTSQTTTVSANGTFELKVEAGTFTLIFQSNGVEIGRIEITATAGAAVKIVVHVESTNLTVVEIKIEGDEDADTPGTCVIAGGKAGQGIELEGNVSSGDAAKFLMTINGERSTAMAEVTASAASYKCNGKKVTDTECKASLLAGAKVHVRGTLMSCTASPAPVTATEVKLQ